EQEADMSAEAPKAAATFSSFINKNTTGKKFAPKAARRRPGAAPTAPISTPTPTPSAPDTSAPAAELPVELPAEPSTTVQLPTPAATQEPAVQPAVQPISHVVTSTPEPSNPIAATTPASPAPGLTTQYLEDGIQDAPAPAIPHESTAQPTADGQAPPQPRKRRTLPWTAVNHAQSGEQTGATADAGEAPPAPKRQRKPRKTKGALSSEFVQGTEDEVGRIADQIVADAVRRKPKAKRKRRATPEGEEVDGIDGENGPQEKKKRGRPPREPTPSDAEDQTVDPDVTYMDSLAARDVRWGKLSKLEKDMRTIDWEAVKQRRREEDSRTIISKTEQEAADRALAEQGAELNAHVNTGPQLRVNETGVMEIVPDTGVIDREGDADRHVATLQVTEDRDITARLTTRSFLKSNKRYPNDFLLPGQGRRWDDELTKTFYEALKSFGTDFQMISTMFPGFTRRSIKTKFTREERDNPEAVKEALQGRCEMTDRWADYLHRSNKTDDSFADADKIKQQMAEKEAEFRLRIAAAQKETNERKRQRELAGVDADGNPLGEAANKENGKGKKTKKKNNGAKHVAFQDEAGVEILGDIGDDDTWGQV
ncbi:hypothetical protein BDW02DRAFT_496274, partial [Decorospora gaudefroyi]